MTESPGSIGSSWPNFKANNELSPECLAFASQVKDDYLNAIAMSSIDEDDFWEVAGALLSPRSVKL